MLGAVDDSLEVREGPANTARPRPWAWGAGRLDSHTPRTSLLLHYFSCEKNSRNLIRLIFSRSLFQCGMDSNENVDKTMPNIREVIY